jgi:hypothetical protein
MDIIKYYDEIVMGNTLDLENAYKHTQELIDSHSELLASDMPSIEKHFLDKNHYGNCLHYSMALFYLLRQHEIESFIAITKETSTNVIPGFNQIHASVCYIKNGQRYIADPTETIKLGKGAYYEIPIAKYLKQHGTIRLYDPYGVHGSRYFFKEFFNYPIEILVGY